MAVRHYQDLWGSLGFARVLLDFEVLLSGIARAWLPLNDSETVNSTYIMRL